MSDFYAEEYIISDMLQLSWTGLRRNEVEWGGLGRLNMMFVLYKEEYDINDMSEGCSWVELGWGGWGRLACLRNHWGHLGCGGMSTPAFRRHCSNSICTPVILCKRCSLRGTSPACRRCFGGAQCWPPSPPPPLSSSLDSIPVSITLKSTLCLKKFTQPPITTQEKLTL